MKSNKILKNTVVKNGILAIVLTIIIVIIVMKVLNVYTAHGEYIEVPDFTGLTVEEINANPLISEGSLVYQITDSVYDFKSKKGTVIAQDPSPASKVKQHRTVYVSIVAMQTEHIQMPNLIDLTLRQAIAILETYGLAINSIEYAPDIAQNAVLKQRYKGKNIDPGTLIEKGAKIDLIVGRGISFNQKVPIPYLLGKKQSEVKKILYQMGLNSGAEIFIDDKDTTHARVFQQKPAFTKGLYLNAGQSVDLWYRSDEDFDFDSFLEQQKNDTVSK